MAKELFVALYKNKNRSTLLKVGTLLTPYSLSMIKYEHFSGPTDRRKNGWTDGWTDGRTDGWTDKRMDGHSLS